jgi:hypothetical protein
MDIWIKYDFERPDYKTYVKRMEKREVIDKSIQTEVLKTIETQPIHNE